MKWKKIMMYLMALLYIVAGINHFIHPAFYMRIIPPYLCCQLMLVNISGICELLFGALLIPAATRKAAAWLIILMLIAIYPANIYMTTEYYHTSNPRLWIAIIRLPIQFLLIWWAWLYTRIHASK